jgi:hypothetical protein
MTSLIGEVWTHVCGQGEVINESRHPARLPVGILKTALTENTKKDRIQGFRGQKPYSLQANSLQPWATFIIQEFGLEP